MMEWLKSPWPWYVAGPLIGLITPAFLLLWNNTFGISSSLRDICAACFPSGIELFKYNWRERTWNLVFVAGIVIGAFLSSQFLSDGSPVAISDSTKSELMALGISDFHGLAPVELFSWPNLLTAKGFIFIILGGFLVGFGTRYAGGCTSGHTMFGLSYFQMASLVASISFFVGGLIMTHFLFDFLF
ncbi:MAG: YeeE/YedE thiosulfate transporter family protein [Imperialibacter sp.]